MYKTTLKHCRHALEALLLCISMAAWLSEQAIMQQVHESILCPHVHNKSSKLNMVSRRQRNCVSCDLTKYPLASAIHHLGKFQ
jgi:hypothetical protein